MKKTALILSVMLLTLHQALPFCGFYVAKADATLFNNKSQIILVRDGDRTTITMSNDFRGNVKDFAMVVPVPTVLKEKDIKVIDNSIFKTLDSYSAPRLVEYYDHNPCQPIVLENVALLSSVQVRSARQGLFSKNKDKKYKVTIEAEYQIGEYDILILSAKESSGLKHWLVDNGYKVPEQAEEVLQPYIKSDMKFFVVKVNLEKKNNNSEELSPIQISFNSDKFMLPIRLGMANADGDQDMIVYAFTKKGRVEVANYRTIEMPTARNIPLFVKEDFGPFYKDVFGQSYEREGRNGVFLEYAWKVTPSWAGVKCDPCIGPPPINMDFAKAGVDWVANGNVFFTRLHVRYSREKFPQDLQFMVTPNRTHYQARYILTHPAQGDLSCEAGQEYLEDLVYRRKKELDELAALTGWDVSMNRGYVREFEKQLIKEEKNSIPPVLPSGPGTGPLGLLGLIAVQAAALVLLIFLTLKLTNGALDFRRGHA